MTQCLVLNEAYFAILNFWDEYGLSKLKNPLNRKQWWKRMCIRGLKEFSKLWTSSYAMCHAKIITKL